MKRNNKLKFKLNIFFNSHIYYSTKPNPKWLFKYVFNNPTKQNMISTKHKIEGKTSFISKEKFNSVDSDGNYKKVKINIGITNRHNSTYESNESHLINKHIKNGNNIKLDSTSGLHTKSYAVSDNYKVKEKKIESSNVIEQNAVYGSAVEHLKSHIKKPLVSIDKGIPVILLNEENEYENDLENPEPIV